MVDMSLPSLCYVFVEGAEPGKRIGLIKRGERGYYLTDFDGAGVSAEIARQAVEHFNARLGVSDEAALAMEIGSMFGWNVPGAYLKRSA